MGCRSATSFCDLDLTLFLVTMSFKILSGLFPVMLLERGIRDISRVLVLARNSVYSALSVEDAIPHVYKMERHRSLRQNPLILSS